MTYEEEQLKYAEELKTVSHEIHEMDEIMNDPHKLNEVLDHICDSHNPYKFVGVSIYNYNRSSMREYVRKQLEESYEIKKARKRNLERLLSQTPSERVKENISNGIGKSIEFLSSITPQHVSGRVYQVENGDGCGLFCFVFMLISAIIGGIIYLCSL